MDCVDAGCPGGVEETVEERGSFQLLHVDRCCVLTEYSGPGGVVAVPEDVTEIAPYVFHQRAAVTQVLLPPGLVKIGRGAFRGCANLSGLRLPGSLEEIGDVAFECCASLGELDVPQGTKRIGWGAFRGCLELRRISFPTTVARMGGHMFGPWFRFRLQGMVPLILGGCRIDPTTLEELMEFCWTGEDSFFEAAAAYLGSGRKTVVERARALLATNPAWAVEVMGELLATYGTARRFRRAGEFAREQAPGVWPEAARGFLDLAQAAGRKKAVRKLRALMD